MSNSTDKSVLSLGHDFTDEHYSGRLATTPRHHFISDFIQKKRVYMQIVHFTCCLFSLYSSKGYHDALIPKKRLFFFRFNQIYLDESFWWLQLVEFHMRNKWLISSLYCVWGSILGCLIPFLYVNYNMTYSCCNDHSRAQWAHHGFVMEEQGRDTVLHSRASVGTRPKNRIQDAH